MRNFKSILAYGTAIELHILKYTIEEIKDRQQDILDTASRSVLESDEGQEIQDAIDCLDEALIYINEALTSLETVLT